MLRFVRAMTAHPACRHPNSHAMAISLLTVSLLYVQFEPLPAGASSQARMTVAPAAELRLVAAQPSATTPETGIADDIPQTAPEIVQREIELLQQGRERLRKTPDYTAQFFKQERIGGTLGDEQLMFMKIRHEPFSVYLKWLAGDKGREVLYVEGQNDGQMIVHAGGWKARLIPALKLDPTGSIAMREARHPVTKAGLLELTETLIEHRQADLQRKIPLKCEMLDGQQFDGRDCYCFVVEYPNREASETYRKSITFVDKEYLLPVCIKNFTWPDEDEPQDTAGLDEATLIEFYSYSDIRFHQHLADIDFDKSNTEYTFRR